MEHSKSGVHLIQAPDGSYHLEFDDTRLGRNMQRRVAASGEALRQTYVAVYDGNHNRQFVKDKKVDQYARIQSFKDQCLIENIIKRCTGGDLSVLDQRAGMYGDISGMPTDPRSMHDLIMRAKEVYESVPLEEKTLSFGGSFDSFLSTFGDPLSLERYLRSKMTNTTTEEVASDVKE